MPRVPEIRQNVLHFLDASATLGLVFTPIQQLWAEWSAANPQWTTSDRAFRQIVYKLREDGYIAYTSPGHKVSPIKVLRTRIERPCPVNGNHRYVCACGKES